LKRLDAYLAFVVRRKIAAGFWLLASGFWLKAVSLCDGFYKKSREARSC
jgi:hypothetical protein